MSSDPHLIPTVSANNSTVGGDHGVNAAQLRYRAALLEEAIRCMKPTIAADSLLQREIVATVGRQQQQQPNSNSSEETDELQGAGVTQPNAVAIDNNNHNDANDEPARAQNDSNIFTRFVRRITHGGGGGHGDSASKPNASSDGTSSSDPFVTSLLFDAVSRGDVAGIRAFNSVFFSKNGQQQQQQQVTSAAGIATTNATVASDDAPSAWSPNVTCQSDPLQRTPLHMAVLFLHSKAGRAVVVGHHQGARSAEAEAAADHTNENTSAQSSLSSPFETAIAIHPCIVSTDNDDGADNSTAATTSIVNNNNAPRLPVISKGLSLLRLLLEDMKANPNIPDSEGRTALHYLVDVETSPLVKTPPPSLSDAARRRVRQLQTANAQAGEKARAQEAVVTAAIALLKRHGAMVSLREFASANGKKRNNRNGGGGGEGLNAMDLRRRQRTALHIAVERFSTANAVALLKETDEEIVGGLIGGGKSVNHYHHSDVFVDAVDADGFTALHHATYHEQLAVIKALLNAGADVSIPTQKEFTSVFDPITNKKSRRLSPLHIAVLRGTIHPIHPLSDAGANFDAICDDGLTPFHAAAKRNLPTFLKELHLLGCNVEMRGQEDNMFSSLLTTATATKTSSSSAAAAQHHHHCSHRGYTALHVAAEHGALEAVKTLIEDLGADREARADTSLGFIGIGVGKGKRALHIARDNHQQKVVEYLEAGMSYGERLLY